jgi:hypothetical protein
MQAIRKGQQGEGGGALKGRRGDKGIQHSIGGRMMRKRERKRMDEAKGADDERKKA